MPGRVACWLAKSDGGCRGTTGLHLLDAGLPLSAEARRRNTNKQEYMKYDRVFFLKKINEI